MKFHQTCFDGGSRIWSFKARLGSEIYKPRLHDLKFRKMTRTSTKLLEKSRLYKILMS